MVFNFIFSNIIFLSLNAQEDAPKPSAIFKAVFWDRFTSKNLSYAPWGNYEENNATMVSLQVGFSTVSRPFAYYGSSPVKFLRRFINRILQLILLQAIMKERIGRFLIRKIRGSDATFSPSIFKTIK